MTRKLNRKYIVYIYLPHFLKAIWKTFKLALQHGSGKLPVNTITSNRLEIINTQNAAHCHPTYWTSKKHQMSISTKNGKYWKLTLIQTYQNAAFYVWAEENQYPYTHNQAIHQIKEQKWYQNAVTKICFNWKTLI